MEIGCAGHVVNLIAQWVLILFSYLDESHRSVRDILHALGIMPDSTEVDVYEQTRHFDLAYRVDEDQAVIDESLLMEKELSSGTKVTATPGRHDDNFNVESDISSSESASESNDEAWRSDPKPHAAKVPKPKRQNTIVDKVRMPLLPYVTKNLITPQ